MQLKKASRTRAKLRIGLFGAAGAGKTYSALLLASGLAPWDKIAVIDTERGSADLYSHLGGYNTLTLDPPFEPQRYIDAITTCEREGMEVIIIDSISHEWNGKGGCLELADKAAVKNDFAKWKDVTPKHNAFIDRILQCGVHVICCGRSKDDVNLVQNEKGKFEPQKVGLKAVTRDGFDFEMTVCFDLDKWHQALCSKDRTQLFDGKPAFTIDEKTGRALSDWMNTAPEPAPPVQEINITPEMNPREAVKTEILNEAARQGLGMPEVFEKTGITLTTESTVGELQEVLRRLLNDPHAA